MHATDSTARPFLFPAALPLFIAYGAFPATSLAARHWFGHEFLDGPESVLLGLAGFAVFISVLKPRTGKGSWLRSLFWFTLFGLLLAGLILFITPAVGRSFPAMIRLVELRPAAYILFGMLWAWTFGPPRRQDFLAWGAVLGALVLTGAGLSSWETGAFARPGTLFESETWGALLAVAVCVRFCSEKEPDTSSGAVLQSSLAVLGIMATMSRTGLLGLALCALFLARRTISVRALFILGCTAAAALSFLLNEPPVDTLEKYSRHWLWWSGISLLVEHPGAMWFGFPAGTPLPLAIPESLSMILGVRELYPGDMPPFWLHVLMTWGVAGIALCNACAMGLLIKYPARLSGGVLLLCGVLGLNHELLYSAQVAVPVVLAVRMGIGESGYRPLPRDEDFVFSG